VPPPRPEDLFNHVYAELTERQAHQLRRYKVGTTISEKATE
jgi:hypothetical protein